MTTPKTLHAPDMPLHTHWTSRDIADAVPLRLSQLLDFDAGRDIGTSQTSANTVALRRARRQKGFVQNTALPFFHIR